MDTIKVIFAAAVAAAAAYLHHLLIPVLVLIALNFLDWASGVWAAWLRDELSSRVGVRGFARKLGYWLMVVVGIGIDYILAHAGAVIGQSFTPPCLIGLLMIVWLSINELISIAENVARAGGPVPPWLGKMLNHLKQRADEAGGGGGE